MIAEAQSQNSISQEMQSLDMHRTMTLRSHMRIHQLHKKNHESLIFLILSSQDWDMLLTNPLMSSNRLSVMASATSGIWKSADQSNLT